MWSYSNPSSYQNSSENLALSSFIIFGYTKCIRLNPFRPFSSYEKLDMKIWRKTIKKLSYPIWQNSPPPGLIFFNISKIKQLEGFPVKVIWSQLFCNCWAAKNGQTGNSTCADLNMTHSPLTRTSRSGLNICNNVFLSFQKNSHVRAPSGYQPSYLRLAPSLSPSPSPGKSNNHHWDIFIQNWQCI